jgi:hypothetical protein
MVVDLQPYYAPQQDLFQAADGPLFAQVRRICSAQNDPERPSALLESGQSRDAAPGRRSILSQARTTRMPEPPTQVAGLQHLSVSVDYIGFG